MRQLQNWTHGEKKAKRTLHLSCSCYMIIWHQGLQTCRVMVKSRIKKHCRVWKMKISEVQRPTRETISDHPRPSHPTPLGNSPIVTENHQIWLLHLVSEFKFLPCFFLSLNSFQKFLEARVNFCGFYWSQLLGSLRTLTGLHRGFFSITVQSSSRCGKSPLEMEITFESH